MPNVSRNPVETMGFATRWHLKGGSTLKSMWMRAERKGCAYDVVAMIHRYSESSRAFHSITNAQATYASSLRVHVLDACTYGDNNASRVSVTRK
jgi:hypothetical protein